MKADRDEYKWVRDAMAGQRRSKPAPKSNRWSLRLVDFLGMVLVGISLAFIALAMFK